MATATFGLIVTIVVMVGIAVFILLFERRRAREIETDLHQRPEDRGDRDST
jgi:Na+/glutamate symporter